jgi:hypothetical protein
MLIQLQDDQINTDNASPKELARACVELKKMYDQLDAATDKRRATNAACGLDFADNGSEVTLDIVDRQLAVAWFEKALAELDAETPARPGVH